MKYPIFIQRYINMKFLKKDIISSLLIGLFITMNSSAVPAAGSQGDDAWDAGVAGSTSYETEQTGNSNQHQYQKGQGANAGKDEQTGEGEQSQIREQGHQRVKTTIQVAR